MSDLRAELLKKRDVLRKERDDLANVVSKLTASLAQHREGLTRTDGALFVVDGLLKQDDAALVAKVDPTAEAA